MPVLLGGEVIVVVCVIAPPVLPALVPICGEVLCVTCVLKLPERVISPPTVVPDAAGEVGKWPAMN